MTLSTLPALVMLVGVISSFYKSSLTNLPSHIFPVKKMLLLLSLLAFSIISCALITTKLVNYTYLGFELSYIPYNLHSYCSLSFIIFHYYQKIWGKVHPNTSILVNNTITQERLWFIHHVKISDGIHRIKWPAHWLTILMLWVLIHMTLSYSMRC